MDHRVSLGLGESKTTLLGYHTNVCSSKDSATLPAWPVNLRPSPELLECASDPYLRLPTVLPATARDQRREHAEHVVGQSGERQFGDEFSVSDGFML